jgi:hypothetical protein
MDFVSFWTSNQLNNFMTDTAEEPARLDIPPFR